MFAAYLEDLLQILKKNYPDKKFLLILDNCRIHKTTAVNLVLQDRRAHALFLPPYTPEFSAIENFFGAVKRKLQDFIFKTKEELACECLLQGFGIETDKIEGFFRNVLKEMQKFHNNIDVNELFPEA